MPRVGNMAYIERPNVNGREISGTIQEYRRERPKASRRKARLTYRENREMFLKEDMS